MQPCRFALPAGWQSVPPPSPAPAADALAASTPPQPAMSCLRPMAAPAAQRAYVAVLAPIQPDGELLAQLKQGVEQELATLTATFGGRVEGRSPVHRILLGAGAGGLQAVWLSFPATAEAPPYEEGRMYFLLDRRVEGQDPSPERRVPLLFIGGPDALPAHLAALREIIVTLTLGAAVGDLPQPVHAAWSD